MHHFSFWLSMYLIGVIVCGFVIELIVKPSERSFPVYFLWPYIVPVFIVFFVKELITSRGRVVNDN